MAHACAGCDLEWKDKNNPTCRLCDRRLARVAVLGPMTESVNIGMTDLAGGSLAMLKKGRLTLEDKKHICEHLDTDPAELARELRRGVDAVSAVMQQAEREGAAAVLGSRRVPAAGRPPARVEMSEGAVVVSIVRVRAQLERAAEQKLRTVENQALYYILRGLANDGFLAEERA